MNKLMLDIETYAEVNLSKTGVYRYADDPSFEILLLSYAIDDGEIKTVDIACGEKIPDEVITAIASDDVRKEAFNATFERVCLSSWLHRNRPDLIDRDYLNPDSWFCTMIHAAYLGLPLSLEGVGAVLKLAEQKMTEGKALIRFFSIPCKPTKTNGMRTRNLPEHDMEKWNTYKAYNRRDVQVEMEIEHKLRLHKVPDFVWDQYHFDQLINDRGVMLDMEMVENAIKMDAAAREKNLQLATELTGLENPNSPLQIKEWLSSKGVTTEGLSKKEVADLLKTAEGEVRELLLIRQELAKTSVKKYEAMTNSVCKDMRAHGMFQFYGANRTGRFSGRNIQLQNLPQNHLPDLAQARALVRKGDIDTVAMLYDSIPDTLSQLIRTAFVAPEGKKYIVADFSAIEARVLSWLAGEKWRMDVFAKNGDIYCETASRMFGVPVVKHGENGHLRQKGKQCELACGYGGSTGAMIAMGAVDLGMKEEELKPLVDSWREANPLIVDLWYEIEDAAMYAIKARSKRTTHGITFERRSGFLIVTLPSGRQLFYVKPSIGENKFGSESITYEGVGGTKKWERLETFGGKLVENIVQAISRDILVESMMRLSDYDIVMHIHDEVVIEADPDETVEHICKIMSIAPSWAEGLILNADGYETPFYMKD